MEDQRGDPCYTPAMNQYAKRRHQLGIFGPEVEEIEDETAPAPAAPRGPGLPPGVHSFEVSEAGRLDKFLASTCEGLSRTRIKGLVEAGHVTVAGKPASDANLKVKAGQIVEITVPEAAPAEPLGEPIPLTVAFEDADFIIIDKPAGLVVHPAAGHETGTLVNALIAHCGDSLSGIGGVKRPGIVHRLDKDTSGLLVVAKNDETHQTLSDLFADHGRTLSLTRDYLAFVWGALERSAGTIEAPLGRHPWHREKQAVVSEDKGREAITHFQVEATYGRDKDGKPLVSLVRCSLETGRTHQIRVHMAHIGHPVIGDPLYATGFKTKGALLGETARSLVEGLRRQALHATSLGFDHPRSGEELLFTSPLPPELAALQGALEAK
jgi:23S rRNA pseudouridine1911/1915/1917 synthase